MKQNPQAVKVVTKIKVSEPTMIPVFTTWGCKTWISGWVPAKKAA